MILRGFLILSFVVIVACSQMLSYQDTDSLANIDTASGMDQFGENFSDGNDYYDYYNSPSGSYLSAIVAQNRNDWASANYFTKKVLESDPDNSDLKNRAMILSLGSEQNHDALDMARELQDNPAHQDIARLILIINAIKDHDFTAAGDLLSSIQGNKKVNLIQPVIASWIQAGKGTVDVDDLLTNPLYSYDALNIAAVLNDNEAMNSILTEAFANKTIAIDDIERIGDLFYLKDNSDQALTIYQKILSLNLVNSARIAEKSVLLENKKSIPERLLTTRLQHNVVDGTAHSLYDIASLLYEKNTSTSARLFTTMALFLKPDMSSARFLLGQIAADNGQYKEAIKQLSSIPANSHLYLTARRQAADILEETHQYGQAIDLLQKLATDFNDQESRIKIGDIYRRNEQFTDAANAYNNAFSHIEDKNDPSTWHLYYVRGMALERTGQWAQAESDLLKALEFRPDHPYILNYLGYSWADKGTHLDKALNMIRKAVSLRPDDGFIVDSLGWVLYKAGKFEEALPYIERAVEIMPYDPVVNDHLGDIYWRVGRRTEAQFQWSRVLNFSDTDDDLMHSVKEKLQSGLHNNIPANDISHDGMKEARNTTPYPHGNSNTNNH